MWYTVVCGYMSVSVEEDKEYPFLVEKLKHWIIASQMRAVFLY